MKQFFAIFKARNIEYYRDKGALAWAFIFPLLIIAICALAFSNPDPSLLTIGIQSEQSSLLKRLQQLEILQQPYIKTRVVTELQAGIKQVRQHQLDLLISIDQDPDKTAGRYWLNSESSASLLAERLLLAEHNSFMVQVTTGRKVRYVDWVIPGVLGMNLMFGALFGVGYVIVRYRRSGVLKRLQVTPTSALHFLAAQLASRLLIVVVVNVIIFIGCSVFLDIIVLGSYLNLLLITVLGGLSLIGIGLLIACRTANEELAGGLLNVATWPMLFLSEVWFSLDDAPDWLQQLANFMPLSHIVKASRAVMIDGASLAAVSDHLLWLVAITVLAMLAAARLFRWSSNE